MLLILSAIIFPAVCFLAYSNGANDKLFPPSSPVVTPARQAEFTSCKRVTIQVAKTGSALPHGRGSVPVNGASSRSRLCSGGWRFLTAAALFWWMALPHGRGSVLVDGASSRSRLCSGGWRFLTVAALFWWMALPHGRGSVLVDGAPSRSRLCSGGWRSLTVAALFRWMALPHGRGSVPVDGAPSRSRLCSGGWRFLTVAALFWWMALPHGRGSVLRISNRAATVRKRLDRERALPSSRGGAANAPLKVAARGGFSYSSAHERG